MAPFHEAADRHLRIFFMVMTIAAPSPNSASSPGEMHFFPKNSLPHLSGALSHRKSGSRPSQAPVGDSSPEIGLRGQTSISIVSRKICSCDFSMNFGLITLLTPPGPFSHLVWSSSILPRLFGLTFREWTEEIALPSGHMGMFPDGGYRYEMLRATRLPDL